MPNIICSFSLCKHNSAVDDELKGECRYSGTVKLVYVNDGDKEFLDCNCFEYEEEEKDAVAL